MKWKALEGGKYQVWRAANFSQNNLNVNNHITNSHDSRDPPKTIYLRSETYSTQQLK